MSENSDLTLEALAHDLKNVFQTISESLELLRSDSKWTKLADTIQRSADHGHGLVQSILENRRCSVNATSVIDNAVQFARDYLECMHGPPLNVSCEVEPDLRLPGDRAGWERVLVNLFVNAAEAGAKHVDICARQNEIVVRDDGPGISPELLPHIFQPHVSSKPIKSGLGLYVVQSVVEKQGGAVTALNLPNGGAQFGINIGGKDRAVLPLYTEAEC